MHEKLFEKEQQTIRCGDCFTTLVHKNDYYECPKCGWIILDEEAETFDIDEYRAAMHHKSVPIEQPAGCSSCGGEYPLCADSCPMFD